jgi:hypothetical protein
VYLTELEKFAPGCPPRSEATRVKNFQLALARLGGVSVGDVLVLPGGVRWKVVTVDVNLCRVVARQFRDNRLRGAAREIAILSATKE